MARLPYLDVDDLAPEDRELLDQPINLARMLAHSPAGTRAFRHTGAWIRHESRFNTRLREMAILRIGVLTRTDYEYSHHIELAGSSGCPTTTSAPSSRDRKPGNRGTRTARPHRRRTKRPRASASAPRRSTPLGRHLDAELLVELTIIVSY